MPDERRVASTWGSPGAYDLVRDIVYYGIATDSEQQNRAAQRNPFAIPTSSPSALYSNSTVALDGKTGKLQCIQHLPGDDWDELDQRTHADPPAEPESEICKVD
jgi:glucose dehydrogenase